MKVKLTRALKIKIANSTESVRLCDVLHREELLDLCKEDFWIVCLANNNMLLLIELTSFGSSRGTVVEPTEVFSVALQKEAKSATMLPGATFIKKSQETARPSNWLFASSQRHFQ